MGLFSKVTPSISPSILVKQSSGTPPTFDSATYTPETGALDMTFSEPISDTTVNLSKLHVRESGLSSGGVTLTGATSTSVDGSTLTVNLSVSQQSDVDFMITPQIDIDADAVSDAGNNKIVAVTDRPITINDTIKPTFDSAAYVTSDGTLSLTLNEPLSSTTDLSKLHIRESGQSTGGVDLTDSSQSVYGSTIKLLLPDSKKNDVNAMTTPQLDIRAGAVLDAGNNRIVGIADRPITINDTTLPTFDSATYDTETGILRITFGEPIYGADTKLSKLHIRESGLSSGGVTLTNAIPQPVSVGTLTVRLSAAQQNTVNSMTTTQLDIEAGAVSDTATNEIDAVADQTISLVGETTVVTDTVLPTFASAAYNIGTGNLAVTFSESISTPADLSKLHVRDSGQTSGGATLTGATDQSVSGSTLTVELSTSQQNTVNALGTPQLDIEAGAVSDTATNEIDAVADQTISLVGETTVVTDTVLPTFASAAYNIGTGNLAVTFSESISTPADLSKLHVRDSGQTSGGATLTGATDQSVSGSTLTVELSTSQQNTVNALGTPQLDIEAGAVSDTATNEIDAVADQTISLVGETTVVTDTVLPTFASAAYNIGTGNLAVTFSESISTPADLSKLHVRDSGQTSGGATLTGATDQSVSGSTLTVELSTSQQNTVNALGTPQLDIEAGAVSDTATNEIDAVADQTISLVGETTVVTDTVLPTFASAAYNIGTGNLAVTFSESISTPADLSKLHVRESGKSSGGVNMSSATHHDVLGNLLRISLDAVHRDAINALDTHQIDIDAGAVSDTSNNPIAAMADLSITLVDDTLPVLYSATYNTGTGILNVTFNEPISATADLSKLHIRDSGLSSGGATLTGASSQSVSGSTLTVELSTSQQNTVNALGTPQLDIEAGAVTDTATNGIAAAADQSILITDGAAPTFSSAAYSTGTGILNVTFSEPISDTADLSKLHVRDSGQTSGGATLTGATLTGATDQSVSGSTLTVELSTSQKNTVNALDTPQLDIEAGAVSDTADNMIALVMDQHIDVTDDAIRPTLTSAAYNTGTSRLIFTFSEHLRPQIYQEKIRVHEAGQPTVGVTLQGALWGGDGQGNHILRLTTDQKNAIDGMSTPQIDIDKGAFTGQSGNQNAATIDYPVDIIDGIAPDFDSATYNIITGILNVTFNEPISTTVDPSKIHVRESWQFSGGINLTGASSQSVSNSTLTVELSTPQKNTANALDTPQLDVETGAVSDVAGNGIAATADLPIIVTDGAAPNLVSATYSTGTGILNVTFNEPISATADLSKLHVRDQGRFSGGVTMTGVTFLSVSGSTLTVTLSTSQKDAVNAMTTPQLDIDAGAISDIYSSRITAAADRPITVYYTIPPVFDYAAYHTLTGSLNVTFSEPISTTVDPSKIHIREQGQSTGGVNMTGASSQSVSDSTLAVELSTSQKNTVNAMGTPQIDVDAGAVSDTSDNPIVAAEDLPISVTDGTAPTLSSSAYSTISGVLRVTFSEPISTTVDLSKLHVREQGQSSGGTTLAGVTSLSITGSTLTVTLPTVQKNAVNAMTAPQIDVGAGAVSDTSGNLIAAAEDLPITVNDTIPPVLGSVTYHTLTGILNMTLSEPVTDDADLSKLHVREPGQSSGGVNMTGAFLQSASGNTLAVTLSTAQRDTVNVMGTPQLDVDTGAISDTSGNPIAATTDRLISVTDGTALVFSSAAYSTGEGILNVAFSEPVSDTVDLSKLHVREQGQSSDGVTLSDASSSQSVSGSTLTVILVDAQRIAVNDIATPQLDIEAGAVFDAAGNPIAAAEDQSITVNDTILPVFDHAAYHTITGILNVAFSEPISDAVDLEKLHIREQGQSSDGVTLSGASSQSVSGSTLTVKLVDAQRIAVNILDIQQLDIEAGAVFDTADNPVETAADLSISVTDPNQPPTADAGQDQTVSELVPVILDGTGSFDNDGTILAYLWEHTSGPSVTLNANDTSSPTFTSPQVTSDQEVVFTLTVTDNDGGRDQDTVTIFIDDDSIPPALTSIAGQTFLGESFIADSIVFRVTFSEDVTGVDSSDFELSGTGTGSVSSVTPAFGSGAMYDVTVDAGTGGTFDLDLKSSGHDIRDKANNLLTDNVPETDSVYTVSPTSDQEFKPQDYSPIVRMIGSHNFNDTPDQPDPSKGDPYVELGGVYVDKGATCHDRKVPVGSQFPVEIDITSSVTVDTSQLDTSKAGLTQVSYSCTDDEGNTDTLTRLILVFDRAPPVITAPAPAFNITLPRIADGLYYIGDFGAPTAFDFSVADGKSLTFTYTGTLDGVPVRIPERVDSNRLSTGDVLTGFHEGTTVLTWTVSDIYGNSVTTTQNVTINVTD